MDFVLAAVIFFLLLVAPALWRSRKRTKRQLAEKIVLFIFLVWVLFALRACLK